MRPFVAQILLQRAAKEYPADSPPPLRFIRSCSASLSPATLQKLEATFKVCVCACVHACGGGCWKGVCVHACGGGCWNGVCVCACTWWRLLKRCVCVCVCVCVWLGLY